MPQGLVPREKGLPRSSEEASLGRRVQWPEDRQRGKEEEPGTFLQASGPGLKVGHEIITHEVLHSHGEQI